MTNKVKREEVAESFNWAFFTKRMNYVNGLVYDHTHVPASMNDPAKLEPKLQKLDKTSE